MTEEIKEILDYLKPKYDIVDELGNDYKKVKFKDCKLLLDYITNLQQENEKLKYNARGQVNDYFKDKYADEVLKKADLIKDFELTCYKNYELKQENERLNNIINELENYFEEKYNDGYEKLYVEDILYELKELKESSNNEG